MMYDVIIAGSSFAGLAAATQLRGKRVLLIEAHSVGAVRTSARGTLLAVLMATGTTNSLLQVHERIFSLETVIPVEKQGLHFYYDKRQLGADNVGWWFPTGPVSRAGLGSYRGATRLNAALNGLVRNYLGCSSNGIHGGYWPYHRQSAVTRHMRWPHELTILVHHPDILDPLLPCYWKAIDPAALALLWSTGPAGVGSLPVAHVQSNLDDPAGRML